MPCGSNKFVLSAILLYSLLFTSVIIYHHHQHPVRSLRHQEATLNHSFNVQHVHFIETSDNRKQLPAYHACAIESAARAHPNSQVILHVTDLDVQVGYESAEDELMANLVALFPNFRVSGLNVSEALTGTALQSWHEEERLRESSFPVVHLSDALRLALLFKVGGAYLDTDVITLLPLRNLRHALGVELSGHVNNAVMVFAERGHPLLNACLAEYAASWNGSAWGWQGPELVTRVIRKSCLVEGKFNRSVMTRCPEVDVHPEVAFYALPFDELFASARHFRFRSPRSYTAHLWASQTGNRTVTPGDGTTVDFLFRLKCPSSYEIMRRRGFIQGEPKVLVTHSNTTKID